MYLEVKVPTLSDNSTISRTIKWLKSNNDFVAKNEAICKIETAEATVELQAETSGVLHIMKDPDKTVEGGSIVALIEKTQVELIRKSALAQELVELIRSIHEKGWSPATSTNYSLIDNQNLPLDTIIISKSGIDKSKFDIDDFMLINERGEALSEFREFKSSAETLLHTLIYQKTDAKAILHTHSQFATILSQFFFKKGKQTILLENYEVLKGLDNIKTHEANISIPIFENSQDMKSLSSEIKAFWKEPKYLQGFLIAGHGLYTWGKDLKTAKRKLEVLEFLLECEYHKISLGV